MSISHKKGLLSLSPIIVLLVVYLIGSLLAGDFYRIPIGVAFVTAAVYAIAITRGESLYKRVELFSQGAANSNIMYMAPSFSFARPSRDPTAMRCISLSAFSQVSMPKVSSFGS